MNNFSDHPVGLSDHHLVDKVVCKTILQTPR